MVFNSIAFAVFFGLFFLLYWFVFNRNLKYQNLFLLTAGYIFYAWWDWRFLSILIGTSFINYILGISIEKAQNPRHKKTLVSVGVLFSIGVLVVFKYFNFFVTSFIDALSTLHIALNLQTLNIIIPLGLSYYIFR